MDMPKKEEILEGLGFSQNETKLYLALLQMGSSTVSELNSKVRINRSNIYDSLSKLIDRGLVSYIIEKDTKIFEATDPEILYNLVREKEAKLRAVMPELKLQNEMSNKKSEAHIFEGVVALRNILSQMLERGIPRYAYGAPLRAHTILGDFFMESYHRKRIEKKIPFKLIYNHDARERINKLNVLEHTESRYLPPNYDSPVTTNIFGDEVVIVLYAEKPSIIQIKNPQIAAAYKKYFDLLWETAQKK